MPAPVIRQFVGTIPEKGQAQTAFDTNVDAFLEWQALEFAPDLVAFGAFADATGAALVAANLPSLTGRALDAVRVNAAANGVEFADVTAAGWALLDDADATAQRVTLGVVKQTGPIDTTAGSLLTVGAFGLGLLNANSTLADMNVLNTPSGMYRTTSATTGTFPAGASPFGYLLVERYDFNNITESYTPTGNNTGANTRFMRTYNSVTLAWLPWRTIVNLDVLNATGSAPLYACRAWVNFNGTGTVATRGSGNVSSITDNGVGDYTVNFTTSMQDVNYATLVTNQQLAASGVNAVLASGLSFTNPTASAVRVVSLINTAYADTTNITVAIFR